jgi:hypothetical protein
MLDKISIQTPMCPVCWRRGMIQVDAVEWSLHTGGVEIDRCMTNSVAEREQIRTGLHPECFNKLYPKED